MKYPAPSNGILDNIAAKEGETVNVGALLGSIKQSKQTTSSSKIDLNENKYSPPKSVESKKKLKTKTNYKG